MVRSAGRGGHPQPVRVAVEKAIDFLRCDDTFRGSFRGRGRGRGSAPSASFEDASRSLRGASRLSPPPSPKNPSRSIPSEARDNSHPVRAASRPSGPAARRPSGMLREGETALVSGGESHLAEGTAIRRLRTRTRKAKAQLLTAPLSLRGACPPGRTPGRCEPAEGRDASRSEEG